MTGTEQTERGGEGLPRRRGKLLLLSFLIGCGTIGLVGLALALVSGRGDAGWKPELHAIPLIPIGDPHPEPLTIHRAPRFPEEMPLTVSGVGSLHLHWQQFAIRVLSEEEEERLRQLARTDALFGVLLAPAIPDWDSLR